jgi:hypothetical protein
MARREIEEQGIGNLFKFNKFGDVLEGIFKGSREVDGMFGKQTVYDVESEGVVYSAPGSAGLNPKMAKVKPGEKVWITYVDDKEMGKNRDGTDKNPMKVFKVEVDDSQPQLAATGSDGAAPVRKSPF